MLKTVQFFVRMPFFFGYYLFFLVGFLLSLGSFIYLSLSEKVFLKKKTLLFFCGWLSTYFRVFIFVCLAF